MLKNVLIVVDDIEKSIEFYKDLFGLQVILKNKGNGVVNITLHFFLKDIRPMLPPAMNHSIAVS